MKCENCNGSGAIDCHECRGEGRVFIDDGEPYAAYGQKPEFEDCNRCQASGEIACPECGGSGDEDNPDTENTESDDEPTWQQEGFDNIEDWENNVF